MLPFTSGRSRGGGELKSTRQVNQLADALRNVTAEALAISRLFSARSRRTGAGLTGRQGARFPFHVTGPNDGGLGARARGLL
jgi:hypothetical protein